MDATQGADQALSVFVAESAELLHEMESALLQCSGGAKDAEIVNRIFRAAHTLKGSSGLFGLSDITAFVHVLENLLDQVRRGLLPLDDALLEVLLDAKDHTQALVGRVAGEGLPPDQALTAQGEEVLAALGRIGAAAHSPPDLSATVPLESKADSQSAVRSQPVGCWEIAVRFGPEVLQAGMDPLGIIRYLQRFGEVESIQIIDDSVPAIEELDPERCYIGLEIRFRTAADRARIESAFEFVREDCTLRLTPPVAAAAQSQGKTDAPKRSRQDSRMLRIPAGKLDALIDLVGELVIASASVGTLARREKNRALIESVSLMARLTNAVRDGSMRLRMVQIGEVFGRFHRIVRDVTKELGKEIDLVLTGSETELDKSLVERLADPLTHLVRNAVDHGIEPATARIALGKPARGRIELKAYHASGAVIVEVRDDGKGLDRERLLEKARTAGMIAANAAPSDEEIWNLVFEPGLSTAEAVTDLSGRGVGMDVVRRGVEALRGSIEIDTDRGKGTTFRIRLPLTLAVMDGFLFRVGNSHLLVPLDMVVECLQLPPQAAGEPRVDYMSVRGQIVPLLQLREHLALGGCAAARQYVVIVCLGARRAGLVVNALLGEVQAVIKPLHVLLSGTVCVAGSAVLGSGEVALMLDVPALLQQAESRGGPHGTVDSGPQTAAARTMGGPV